MNIIFKRSSVETQFKSKEDLFTLFYSSIKNSYLPKEIKETDSYFSFYHKDKNVINEFRLSVLHLVRFKRGRDYIVYENLDDLKNVPWI